MRNFHCPSFIYENLNQTIWHRKPFMVKAKIHILQDFCKMSQNLHDFCVIIATYGSWIWPKKSILTLYKLIYKLYYGIKTKWCLYGFKGRFGAFLWVFKGCFLKGVFNGKKGVFIPKKKFTQFFF